MAALHDDRVLNPRLVADAAVGPGIFLKFFFFDLQPLVPHQKLQFRELVLAANGVQELAQLSLLAALRRVSPKVEFLRRLLLQFLCLQPQVFSLHDYVHPLAQIPRPFLVPPQRPRRQAGVVRGRGQPREGLRVSRVPAQVPPDELVLLVAEPVPRHVSFGVC